VCVCGVCVSVNVGECAGLECGSSIDVVLLEAPFAQALIQFYKFQHHDRLEMMDLAICYLDILDF